MKVRSSKKLISSIFSYTTALVIAQILVAVYTLILIGWLSAEAYGMIAANYAAVLLTSFIINLGLHEWLIRTIPTKEKSNSITGVILGYKFLAGIIWGFILMIVLPIIKPEIYHPELLIIIILDTWFESGLYLLLADLIGNNKVIQTSILLVTSRILRLFSILIIIFIGSKSTIPVVLLRLLSTMLIFSISFFITKPVFRGQKLINVFGILRSSIVFNAAEIQNLIFLQIDLNLFAILSNDQTRIGNFAIAISLINMIMSFPLGVSSMLLPSTIKVYRDSQRKFEQRMTKIYLAFISFGAILWAGINFTRLNFIQSIFPKNYTNVFSILILASPLLFLRTINQANRIYLISVGKEKSQLISQLFVILFKLIIGIIVTKIFGLGGLIWLSIISDLLLLLGFTFQVFRHRFPSSKNITL